MSDINKEVVDKSLVETKRIRDKNVYGVINQIVEEYNASNGWKLVKAVPFGINLEVYVERSAKQGESNEKKVQATKETPKQQEGVEKVMVDEKEKSITGSPTTKTPTVKKTTK